jgi:acetoacetyl-CoA reductase
MSNRVAVVTGGTGAIGSEICKHLVDMGAVVAATCHPSDAMRSQNEWKQEMQQKGYQVMVVSVDLSDFDATASAFADIEKSLGSIDILVNAAGITNDATMRKMTVDQWTQVISANLNSVFNTTRQVFPAMLEKGFGRIISISSINGQKGQFGQANYAATKAGIHGFTMSIAQEGAKKGVTANTISPGYIATPMVMKVPDNVREQIIAQIPVGRLGKPEEIARLVAFLAADESGFMTGANFAINGGQHMH